MQSRTRTAATLLTIGIAACAQPAADRNSSQNNTSGRQNQELALSAAPANNAVVSAIETTRPGKDRAAKAPRNTLASRKNATRPAVEAAVELPNVDTRINDAPATVAASPAITDIPLLAVPTSGPSVSAADEPAADDVGSRPEPTRGRPGIIIRGGTTSGGRDPCDIHDTRGGRGVVPPVLVNPRIPGVGVPRGGDRTMPSVPSRGGGGGIRL